MAGATGLRFTFNGNQQKANGDAPLFERMGAADELQKCRQVIDALQSRVQDLERINMDLESRLEDQAKQCMAVERECIAIERSWREKAGGLEKEIAEWKKMNNTQELKTNKLREHLSRTEKELYGILQRIYELMRGPGRGGPGGHLGMGGGGGNDWGGRVVSGDNTMRRDGSVGSSIFQEEAYSTNQARQPQEIRQRRMLASLNDFLGL